MFPPIVFLLFFQAICVFGGTKRDWRGEEKASNLGFGHVASNQTDVLEEWARGIDTLAGIAGPKFPMIESLNKPIADLFYTLGKFEVAAFDLIVNYSNLTVDERTAILNEKISPSETVDGRSFHPIRVALWCGKILSGRFLPALEQTEENTDSMIETFLRENIEILTNENGVMYLNLSPKAWDTLIYTSLIHSSFPRTPTRLENRIGGPEIVSPAKSPREFRHILFIIRAFVHSKFFKKGEILGINERRIKQFVGYFDSKSDLVDVIVDYIDSIRTLFIMDMEVYESFYRLSGSRCKTDNMQRLADEWNSIFNETHPPLFNSLYTPERVSFWCTYVTKLFLGIERLVKRTLVYTVGGETKKMDWLQLDPSTGVLSEFLASLSETTLIPRDITADDVIVAWQNRVESPSYDGAATPTIISSAVGDGNSVNDGASYTPPMIMPRAHARGVAFDPNHKLPLGKKRASPDFRSIPPHTRTRIAHEILKDRNYYNPVTGDAGSFANFLKSIRQMPRAIVQELHHVNLRRISTTAVEIVEKLKAFSPTEFSHITPEQVFWFYRVFLEHSVEEFSTAPTGAFKYDL